MLTVVSYFISLKLESKRIVTGTLYLGEKVRKTRSANFSVCVALLKECRRTYILNSQILKMYLEICHPVAFIVGFL